MALLAIGDASFLDRNLRDQRRCFASVGVGGYRVFVTPRPCAPPAGKPHAGGLIDFGIASCAVDPALGTDRSAPGGINNCRYPTMRTRHRGNPRAWVREKMRSLRRPKRIFVVTWSQAVAGHGLVEKKGEFPRPKNSSNAVPPGPQLWRSTRFEATKAGHTPSILFPRPDSPLQRDVAVSRRR